MDASSPRIGRRWLRSARIGLTVLVAGLAVVAAPSALAQAAFPNKPLKIVVPFAPGGIADTLSRLVAQHLQGTLGQPVIVESKTGAAGALGMDAVAKAAPDGYTMVLGTAGPLVISRISGVKLPYDPVADFAPVTQIASAPLIVVVNESVPVKTPKELVELLRAKPDSLSYASAGAGTPSHLATEMFKERTKVQVTHVPYKGTGAAVADLVAGRVQLMMDSPVALLPFVRSGKLRALAVASDSRLPLLPDLPTLAEAGLPGIEVSGWYGLLVPAATPPASIEKLRAAIDAAVRSPEVSARISEVGAVPKTGTPREFSELMATEYARWTPIVKALDLK